jgi:predicted nuclease of restriction endonuclease-like (RecB) superfamily
MPELPSLPSDYSGFLGSVKTQVQQAQLRALVSVNTELVTLYWHIGKAIEAKVQDAEWGTGVIEQLSKDLHAEFPEMRGFSTRNLQYMRTFAVTYPDEAQFAQQAVAQIPWGHHTVLLDKVSDPEKRQWYMEQARQNGWSRSVLELQIKSNLHGRAGKALTNFETTLPALDSDLAQDTLKDPYIFDFITTSPETKERHLQAGLIAHIEKFLLELGVGFAFVNSNQHLKVGENDYYLDLLFYHARLKRYVVIELKTGEFKPEYAGKMSLYLTAVDEQIKGPGDEQTIGLILCTSKDKVTAEYTLRNIDRPLGVATYNTNTELPEPLREQLPEIKSLEQSLERLQEDNSL